MKLSLDILISIYDNLNELLIIHLSLISHLITFSYEIADEVNLCYVQMIMLSVSF